MFFKTSHRLATVALAAASIAGTGLSADPAAAAATRGGVSVNDTVNGSVQVDGPAATAAAVGDTLDVTAITAKIEAAASGAVGYGFSISEGGQPLTSGGAGYARRPLDGTQDKAGVAFTVDTRIEVQLPGVQQLLPAKKGAKARRALKKLNASLLVPTGVEPTSCGAKETASATHVYNAQNLAIGGTLIGAGTACGPNRGLLLSAADLTRLAPLLTGGKGGTKGAWTTAAGQSDDGQVSWQSGDVRLPGGREAHVCLAKAGGLDLSIIFNAQIPGDQSPCRILLDATNGSRTAS